MANEIVPAEMHKPLLDLIATGERIYGRLTRNDIRQIQPVIRQDLDFLRELVAKLDAGFEASKDRPNGTVVLTGDFLFGFCSPIVTAHVPRLQKVCRPLKRLIQRLDGRGEALGVETERGSDHCGLGASRK